MLQENEILVTGGSGLLGGEMKLLIPNGLFPLTSDFDVTNYSQMDDFLSQNEQIKLIFHAGAFTSPPKVDLDPINAMNVNIIGTANVVKLCAKYNIKLVYICTDYVFKGDKGLYSEEDPVCPVNKYSWSKLGGECAVRMYDNSIIIRTSLGPNIFPYDKAFVDQWTSREPVKKIAVKILQLINLDAKGVFHIGGSRKTVFEYASEISGGKEIGRLSVNEISFKVPVDTSLNTDKFKDFIANNWK